jgi:WRKY transcription factor 22
MEHLNDWDLQAVVRSCSGFVSSDDRAGPPPPPPPAAAETAVVKREPREAAVRGPAAKCSDASLYDLDYLDLDRKPFLLSATPPSSHQAWAAADDRHEVMISFPAAASTSGSRPRVPPGRKPGMRSTTPRPKRRYVSGLILHPARDFDERSTDYRRWCSWW